uniref:Uncharacterized protein n=1 Tax=Triticum urartu TaxID=4572 RepID=A0A8R7UG51_TRIUA
MVSRVFLKNESVDGMTWGASAAPASSSRGVGEEGEQVDGGARSSSSARLQVVVEEELFLGHPERAVRAGERGAGREGGEDDGPDGGHEDDERRRRQEPAQRLPLGEGLPKGRQRGRVGGAEEVERAPGGEEREQGGERERVRQEGGGEGERDEEGVVDAEVGEVPADAGGGVGEGVRAAERRAVEELRPRARAGEGALGGVEEAGEIGALVGRRGGVRGGEDDGGGRGGGRRDNGDGEEGRRSRGHGVGG